MADQLYLSYWLRNSNEQTMLRHYEKLLRIFPYSRLMRQPSTFKIIAVDYDQPALLEVPYPPPVPIDHVLAVAKEFANTDSLLSARDLVGPVAIRDRLEAGAGARGAVLLWS